MAAIAVHVTHRTGRPRSVIRIVTWCRLSGDSDQKSHIAVGERRFVFGCRFWVWMKSGNLYGSRTKNTGVLLPTRSQLPSLGVELQREAAHVALGIRSAQLAGHGREAREHVGLGAGLREQAALVYFEMSPVMVSVP